MVRLRPAEKTVAGGQEATHAGSPSAVRADQGAAAPTQWKGPDIRRLAARDPGFALDVIDRLAGFVQAMTENIDGFLRQDARRRVIRVLLRYRDLFFGEPAVLSRAELPSLVGTSREMTGRVLRELEREGLVARVGRRGLRLLRPEDLELDGRVPRGGVDR